jgi:cysteine desulfurase/selenocysteine lyase
VADVTGRADIRALRRDFPLLAQHVGGRPLVYLDSAATSQKPNAVIEAITAYYRHDNANVHRAAHALSERATNAFEAARRTVQRFVGARSPNEIVFTRGTTESINLVAQSWGARLRPGDEILVTQMEHHSNLVPWQLVAERTGARLRAVAVTGDGVLDLDDFRAKLGARTRMLAVGHVSNALGTINPVAEMIAAAHAAGAVVLVDGAQAAAHLAVDVAALDCDFYAFSGHKVFGPTGIGVLYGRESVLDGMPPWQGGGEMIETVTIERSTYNRLPYKFEAGTPHIAGAIGLGAALDYLLAIDPAALAEHEARVLRRAVDRLRQTEGVRLLGPDRERSAIVSFVLAGAHPHDVGTLLDQQGIAVRTGHHCAMPLMQELGVPGTVRASLALYNDEDDVDRLLEGLERTRALLA